ncbi:hypothetical protein [Microbacterium paludicola]|uniref:DUF4352 domain-containing protein n=1 Tax=Microbacterium paludicola TaxID=300019 RepID=A0A4Y9FWE9_9MICO|nr:hypothetical protein [Microbacterium paludicola]MBF0816444.1 hypothetical protein [Microbacterium paludicola]TFU32861.1 hypothetical protein E4U02_08480 [Microbacterium paludicola]
MNRAARLALHWAAAAALVAAAWGLHAITPPGMIAAEPFRVDARIGEPAEGRNLRVTVNGVHAASKVTEPERGWYAEGRWVVVEFEAEATESEREAYLSVMRLRIGDRTYRASERPGLGFGPPARLSVGLPRQISAAFELPENAGGIAELGIAYGAIGDERADSLVVMPIDLDALEVQPEVELAPPGWAE